jgi:uncharacterized protein (TIGR02145 family)
MNYKILFNLLFGLAILITTTYGCKKENVPIPEETIMDIDSNIYHTVTIGTQVWMAENLKVTHYRNGDIIPNGLYSWGNTGAYCIYDNDSINNLKYGKLYNWFAVNDPRNLAPIGWHVPSDSDWTVLTNYLGGLDIAGGKLKKTGIVYWQTPNVAATNNYNFSALPGGYRVDYNYKNIRDVGAWWSSTIIENSDALVRIMNYNEARVIWDFYPLKYGLSVRCVKD